MKEKLGNDFYGRIKHRLHKRIGRELRAAGRVLDMGCGCCDLEKYLAATYLQKVTGVDLSSGDFPRRRQTQNGARFHCLKKDASTLDSIADASMDAIVTVFALHEMDHPANTLAEAWRTLRPGGEILVVDFPKGSRAEGFWHEKYYRPSEIEDLLTKAMFKDIQVRLTERRQVVWARAFRPAVNTTGRW